MGLKLTRGASRAKTIVIVLLIIALFYSIRVVFFNKQKVYEPADIASVVNRIQPENGTPYYVTRMKQEEAVGARTAEPEQIDIVVTRYSKAAPEAKVEIVRDTELNRDVLHWNSGEGSVEWDLQVPVDGSYNIVFDYMPLPGTSQSAIRGIQIDDAYPFRESANLEFERRWKDSKYPYERNEMGNEVRAPQTEIEGWTTKAATDYRTSSLPLEYDFTKGRHTLRMTAGREPLALSGIRIVPSVSIPDYRAYAASFPAVAQSEWSQVFEAERFVHKSDLGIQKYAVMLAGVTPDAKGHVVYNTLGADRWQLPGQWVDWEIQVPADGWYAIDVKYRQAYKGKANVYRTIMFDGAVLFKELLHYIFPFENGTGVHTLQHEDGEPFLFYMTKGAHTLRMIADASPDQPALIALQQTLADLRRLDTSLRMVVGDYSQSNAANIDLNRTWEIEKYVPDINERLALIIDQLHNIMRYLNGLNGAETNLAATIQPSILTLQSIANHIEDIPNRLSELTTIQSTIGTWLDKAGNQPLLLDSFAVRTKDAETPLKTAGMLGRMAYSTVNFARTFWLDYSSRKQDDDRTINIWVQRSRDYVDLLREHIDQDFTPNTGIKVNLNMMPNANALVLSNAAGDLPDVALGITMETPVDFAMRGAAADLTAFPGFEQVMGRFSPGVMRSYTYNQGVYGLPETLNFQLFFYRSDIFDTLGLEPPETWDDVYQMLPTLQENGMTLYVPPKDYVRSFYQYAVNFYSDNGMHNRLNEETAVQPFMQWTDLFKKYYLPLEIPAFFNHFRQGTIPAGIADFTTYLQLTSAAPDIAGQWKVAPIPGTKQPDGTIARWTQQVTTGMMMLDKSRKKEQAWSFMQWWSKKETQLRYARDIESYLGIEYRWNSANLQALVESPWPADDLVAIKEQERWIKNVPLVPGYYFLAREMEFAWNAVVLQKVPAKEALEKASLALQREMNRKQQQFGFDPATYDLHVPQLDQPYDWEGANDADTPNR